MEIMEAIEALKNNNELCRDGSEGECLYCEDDKCYCAVALVVSALEEYIAIGTVEECREARERQRGEETCVSFYFYRWHKTSWLSCMLFKD